MARREMMPIGRNLRARVRAPMGRGVVVVTDEARESLACHPTCPS